MLAASCDRNAVRTVNLENIPTTEPYTAGLESIVQKIETVELKCDSLYDIRIFADYDGRLFGRTADNKLVIFSEDGTLLHAYNKVGRGPGEYVWPVFSYDPYNHEILVYDGQNKVIRMDSDGRFIDEVRNSLTGVLGDIIAVSEDRYAATKMSNTERDSSIIYLDRDLNITGKALPIYNKGQLSTKGIIAMEPVLLYNSTPMFKPIGGFTYYTLDGAPYLHVELGRYAQPEDEATVVEAEESQYLLPGVEDICGDWYLAEFYYEKGMCVFYEAVNTRTGEHAVHDIYTEQNMENGEDEGFLFHHDFKGGLGWNTEITFNPLIDDLCEGTLVHETRITYTLRELRRIHRRLEDIALEMGMRNEFKTDPDPGYCNTDTSWYIRLSKSW